MGGDPEVPREVEEEEQSVREEKRELNALETRAWNKSLENRGSEEKKKKKKERE